jgi:hypothetical protein
MTRLARGALATVAAFLVTVPGCGPGVLLHGTTQRVPVSSDPPGAGVEIDGVEYPAAPVTAVLARNADHVVKVRSARGDTTVVRLRWRICYPVAAVHVGLLLIDPLYLGLPILVIDAYRGGLFRLAPEQVQVAGLSPQVRGTEAGAVELEGTFAPLLGARPGP